MFKNKELEETILTKKQVAQLFQVHVNTISNWTKDGLLKSYSLGQRVYFKKSECLEVLFSNSKTA